MRVNPDFFFLIVGMGVVTYLPRWLPLACLSQRRLPDWLTTWLDFIPAAILSALILPELVTAGSPRHVDFFRPEFIVAIPLFAFAARTRSLGGTVIAGMALFWIASRFF
jgi:branched-subunit amino acid transport protein